MSALIKILMLATALSIPVAAPCYIYLALPNLELRQAAVVVAAETYKQEERYVESMSVLSLLADEKQAWSYEFSIKYLTLWAELELNLGKLEEAKRSYTKLVRLFSERTRSLQEGQYVRAVGYLGLVKALHSASYGDGFIEGFEEIESALLSSFDVRAPDLQAELLNILASYHIIKNEYFEAEQSLLLAIDMLQTRSSAMYASLYNHLGMTYELVGSMRQAQMAYREALISSKDSNHLNTYARVLNNLATSYKKTGDFNLALRQYEAAFQVAQTLRDDYSLAVINMHLGDMYLRLGQFSRSEQALKDSFSYFSGSNPAYRSKVENLLIKLLLEQEEEEKALVLIKERGDIASNVTLAEDKIDSYLLLAKVMLLNGYPETAITALNAIEAQFEPGIVSDMQKLEAKALSLSYHQRKGNLRSVKSILEEALSLIESSRLNFSSAAESFHWTDSTYFIIDQYLQSIDLEDFLENRERQWEIFQVLERTRANSLYLMHSTSNIVFQYEQPITAEYRNYLLLKKKAMNANEAERKRALTYEADLFKERLLARADSAKAVSKSERERHFGSVADVQSKLSADSALAYYHLGDHYSLVYFFSAQSFSVQLLPESKKISEAIDKVYEALQVRIHPSELFTSESLEVVSMLLPREIVGAKDLRSLIIVADKELHKLPFSLLNTSGRLGKYKPLVKKMALVYSYSLHDFLLKADSKYVNKKLLSIFASPELRPSNSTASTLGYQAEKVNGESWLSELPKLPFSAYEADSIVSLFQKKPVSVLKGVDATVDNFLSEEFRDSSVIHISTHTYVDSSIPGFLGLVTTPTVKDLYGFTGFLTMDELLSYSFFSNLVVISGCETGYGYLFNGEGPQSLSNVFIGQGAKSTLSSYWPVPDKASADFMIEFYQNLIEQEGDAIEALAETQREFISSGRYRHPYFWSGYFVTSLNEGVTRSVFSVD